MDIDSSELVLVQDLGHDRNRESPDEFPIISRFSRESHLDTDEPDPGHLEKQQPMAKPLDIGFAIGARQVANGYVNNSQSQNSGRVEELKITERIEIAEIAPPGHHALEVAARNEFRPAERITDADIQNAAERFCEENISQPVEKAHCIPFHRVHQPRTVNEIAEALAIGFVEAPQHFGRHGQVRVQNDEKRLGGMRKTEPLLVILDADLTMPPEMLG